MERSVDSTRNPRVSKTRTMGTSVDVKVPTMGTNTSARYEETPGEEELNEKYRDPQ